MKICGAVLIVLGFIGLALGGVPYQSRENVAQLGDFKMEITEKKTFPIPPLVSGLVILIGAGLMFASRRKHPG
jgi:hypothetical protein